MTKEKWLKVGKGALIAIGGAVVAYIPEAINIIDWGTWTPIAVAMGGVLVNMLRQLLIAEPA
jgi:hypothetical protein